MNSLEKFCLKWDDFEANIKDSFKRLRDEQKLFDITLATSDGQQIQAHRMVLAAGSHFFSDILTASNQSNMFIYLKGINMNELGHILDFMYNGETSIIQEELNLFLETAKELQVKGLQGDLQDIGQSMEENEKPNSNQCEKKAEYEDYVVCQENILDEMNELADSFFKDEGTLATVERKNLPLNSNVELDLQIQEMIEKKGNIWMCKVCGKTAKKSHIKNHAETHIKGVVHICDICNKILLSRNSLNAHISNTHSKLSSCNLCEKSGMSRLAYNEHKRKNH